MENWVTVAAFILCIAVLAALIVLIEGRRELHSFRVTHYNVGNKMFHNLDSEKKIVFLTDLHCKVYGDHNAPLLDAIRLEKPDLILVGGDMLIGKKTAVTGPALDFVTRLPDICPVYYCNGNHEERLLEDPARYGSSYHDYRKALIESGIHLLANESEELWMDRLKIQLTGLELPVEAYERGGQKLLLEKGIDCFVKKPLKDRYHLLLAHDPSHMKLYKEWGADMILSGHLHGGIIRIPGIGGLITPRWKFFPKYSGEMTVEGETTIIVSRGLGTHTVNLRFCNPAEVVVIHLKPQK